MQNLLNDLKELLQSESRFTAGGKLLKNKIAEAALQPDPVLLRLLLSHTSLKKYFFTPIENVLIFDKIKFQQFVSKKEFFENNFTSFKNKIGLTANEEFLSQNKNTVLSWPYKDCILQGSQTKEDSRQNEVFFNSTMAPDDIDRLLHPKAFTNILRYTATGSKAAVGLSFTDNFIIKGNNLLALSSLREVYRGQVRLIYIDPPYNTGNDSFRYNDSFNHSTWLTFMKNRLDIAKELLSNDGYIVIQIDNNEESYLKVLCDEIFGRQNYRNSIITKKGTKSLQKQFTEIQKLNAGFDTLLLYSKKEETRLPNLFKELKGATTASWNNHWRGTDRPTMRYSLFGTEPETGQWRWEKNRTETAVENYIKLCCYIEIMEGNDIVINDSLVDEYYPLYLQQHDITSHADFELVRLSKNKKAEHYIPPRMQILLSENWMDLSVAGRITKFEHEKNEEILKRIIEWLTAPRDIVLDFFLGSGSTAAVSHKLHRQYIGIEQMHYGNESAVQRLADVIRGDDKGISPGIGWKGGGNFVYAELAKLNQAWVDKINIATETELHIYFKEITANPFLIYTLDIKAFLQNEDTYKSLSLSDKKTILIQALDHNQLYISYSEMEDKDFALSESDVNLNHIFYKMK